MRRPALAFAPLMPLAAQPALADLQVRMPTVEYRELEFEHNGLITFANKDSSLNGAQSYTNAIGYGVLPWWKITAILRWVRVTPRLNQGLNTR